MNDINSYNLRTEIEIMSAWKSADNPIVSIACAVFNHEKFLDETINGFLIQKTDFPFEIILHDDASTDNSKEIIKKYANEYPSIIKTIYQAENQYSKKIKPFVNFMVPACDGKYIAKCEGDDYWIDEHKLQKQVEFLESHQEFILCAGKSLVRNHDEIKEFWSTKTGEFTFKDIAHKNFLVTNTVVFRNLFKESKLDSLKKYFGKVSNGDILLYSALLLHGKGFILPYNLGVYREHCGGINSQKSDDVRYLNSLKTRNTIIEYLKEVKADAQFVNSVENGCITLLTDYLSQNQLSKEIKNVVPNELLMQALSQLHSNSHYSDSYEKQNNLGINRVLFVNHNIYPFEHTGTPITTLNHALGIKSKGIDVAVLVPSTDVQEDFIKVPGDKYILYKVPRLDKYETFYKSLNQDLLSKYIYSIIRIINDFKPQVVHINDYVFMPDEIIQIFSQSGAYVIRNVCNTEEICHLDSPVYFDGVSEVLCSGPESAEKCARCFFKNVLKKKEDEIQFAELEKYSANIQTRFDAIKHHYKQNVDGVFFTSPGFKNYFKQFIEIPGDIISVIPRGFNFNKERKTEHKKANSTKINIGFLGSLIPIKGIDLVLKAFNKISSTGNFCLNIYGTGAPPALLNSIRQLEKQFPGKIIFHGNYNNSQIENIAENLDFALVPSNFDTFNRIVRELMFFGVPLIVTDFFGASIVENNVNGIKIKIGDADALADSMKHLVENPSVIEELSKGVMNTPIANLDYEINGIHNFYKTIIDVKGNKKATVNQYDLLLKAEALIEQNKLDEAKRLLKTIIVLHKTFIDAMNDLSVVHIMLEEYPDALEQIKNVLSLDPLNEIATGNLLYLESQLKQNSESELQKV